MAKSITVIKLNQEHVSDLFKNGLKTDMVFREIQKDTIGKSGASPTWGYTYYNEKGKMKFKGIALHKEYDYDYPLSAYGEKVWSIFGKELLNESVKVPNIEIVSNNLGQDEIISYILFYNKLYIYVYIRQSKRNII